MKASNNHKAIIIYGPPGSGKGTQAELLANKLDFIHFDTGKYLRKLLHDPKLQKDKTIQSERRLNDSGKLNTSSWVLKIVTQKTKEIDQFSKGVIFSGSPRSVFEAFGDKNQNGLMDILEKIYGKKNIYIFEIGISENETIKRNTHRLVCSICRSPIMGQSSIINCKLNKCPFCGGKLKHRFDDKKEVILTRLKEYQERTKPIISKLKNKKYKVIFIDGKPMPFKIHEKIIKHL
ncbi:MAG: nucleoside monophosphate kinase [Patescibacteria group bacterium]